MSLYITVLEMAYDNNIMFCYVTFLRMVCDDVMCHYMLQS